MALCWNEAEATKAIKEAQVHCGVAIREAETYHATVIRETEAHHTILIREAEANCSAIVVEAEACCTTNIRKVQSCCVENAHSIQQLHAEDMQCLEMATMEEEGKDCLSFLVTCGMALQTCPTEAHGVLMGPLQLLMGNIPLATLLNIPPRCASPGTNLPP